MILSIETTLGNIAHMLRERIAPAVEDEFAAETARLAGMLLDLSASWVADAAAIRVAENAQIRSLLGDATSIIADSDLAERLAVAGGSHDPGLNIDVLDCENNRLRALLGELHAHLDASDAGVARDFNQRIWRALAGFEDTRAPH